MTQGQRPMGVRGLRFAQGRNAWHRATGDEREMYVCPLCGWGFTKPTLQMKPPLLTLEDVPSRAAGGRPLVLTCGSCNHKAGQSIDAAIAAREEVRRIQDALLHKKATYSRPGRMEIDGVETQVDIKMAPEFTTVVLPVRRNNPTVLDQQVRLWQERSGTRDLKFKLHFRVPGYDDRKALLGDLKAAYLAAFAVFGYHWAFHPRVHIVRQQLWEPDIECITQAWLPNHEGRTGIALMKQPVSCLVVSLRDYEVILPWITGPDDIYAALATASTEGPFTATVEHFDWPTRPEMMIDFDERIPVGVLKPAPSFEPKPYA
jgi:hypothetical protein